jgi:hypothetical protein
MPEVAGDAYGHEETRLAKSPWFEVSVVDQPPNTTFVFVGSEGLAIVWPVLNVVPEIAVPPFESQVTLFRFPSQTAFKVVVPVGAVNNAPGA